MSTYSPPALLIDANVWLDCFLPGRKNRESSLALIEKAIDQGVPLFYTAGIAKDVFYLVTNDQALLRHAPIAALSSQDALRTLYSGK